MQLSDVHNTVERVPDLSEIPRVKVGRIHTDKVTILDKAKDVLANTNHTQPHCELLLTLLQRQNGPVCCCMTLLAASALQ